MKNKLNNINKERNIKIEKSKNFNNEVIEELFDIYKKDEKVSIEKLKEIKKEIESIKEITEFMYQSTQAKQYNEEGIISEFDAEILSPRLEESFGEISKMNLEPIDVITIYDNYNGNLGIVNKTDTEIKIGINNFVNLVYDSNGNHNEDEYFELYNKNGEWCEIHVNFDEDEEKYELLIDEIPAGQKIKSTRDFDYSKFKVESKEKMKSDLLKYFDL